ncbi:MAG: hypothetical protein ACRDWD_02650, partial [Acidimicrobiia bacterium]
PRLVLEVALVRLARRDGGPPLQTLADRVEKLERAVGDRPAAEAAPPGAPGRALGAVRRERAAVNAEPESVPEPVSEPVPEPEPPDASGLLTAEGTERPSAPPAQKGGTTAIDIDDVVVAWAGALDALPVPVRRSVQEAQPLRLDGDVIVFGVPPHFLDRARTRFRQEADAIRAALAEPLGADLRFKLVSHAGFHSSGSAGAPESAPEPVSGGAAVDSLSSFQDRFGATVVEEHQQ